MSLWDRRSFLTVSAGSLTALKTRRALAMSAEDDPLGVRGEFPAAENQTFLNTAWVGPIPQVARDAGVAYADETLIWADSRSRLDEKELARTEFAELFGAKPEEVALLFTTADGEAIVINGLDLQPGDNIVVDALHYTGTFSHLMYLQDHYGIELRVVPHRDGGIHVEDFESYIDARTRLVSVAWVNNRNGFRLDLEKLVALAHAKGTLVYADVVQGLGTCSVNLTELGVDFACAAAHKWLFGGYGVAGFFIREEHLERIRPDRWGHGQVSQTRTPSGWVTGLPAGRFPELEFRHRVNADKYEYSCLAYGAVAQLAASLGLLKQVGLAEIEAHTMPLARELRAGIADLGFSVWTPEGNQTPIVSFVHRQEITELMRQLTEARISVSFREHDRALMRVSVSLFNNRSDVQRLLDFLKPLA